MHTESLGQTHQVDYERRWLSMLITSKRWGMDLSNLRTPSIIGTTLFVFPWANSKWVHIDFGQRKITKLTKKTRFANYAIFKRSTQRSNSSSTTPSTTRSKGATTIYSGRHKHSPTSSSTLTSNAQPCTCRWPAGFTHMLFNILLDQFRPKITSFLTVFPSTRGTKSQTDSNIASDSKSMQTRVTISRPQRPRQHCQSRSHTNKQTRPSSTQQWVTSS